MWSTVHYYVRIAGRRCKTCKKCVLIEKEITSDIGVLFIDWATAMFTYSVWSYSHTVSWAEGNSRLCSVIV